MSVTVDVIILLASISLLNLIRRKPFQLTIHLTHSAFGYSIVKTASTLAYITHTRLAFFLIEQTTRLFILLLFELFFKIPFSFDDPRLFSFLFYFPFNVFHILTLLHFCIIIRQFVKTGYLRLYSKTGIVVILILNNRSYSHWRRQRRFLV